MLGLHDFKGISNTSEKMMGLLCLGQGKIVVVVVFPFKEVRKKEGKEEMGSSEERNLRRK